MLHASKQIFKKEIKIHIGMLKGVIKHTEQLQNILLVSQNT